MTTRLTAVPLTGAFYEALVEYRKAIVDAHKALDVKLLDITNYGEAMPDDVTRIYSGIIMEDMEHLLYRLDKSIEVISEIEEPQEPKE